MQQIDYIIMAIAFVAFPFITYCRGASIHGRMPLFLDKWLLQVNADEPSWRLQRGWLVALIGLYPAYIVYDAMQFEWYDVLSVALLTSTAFTFGHARYQDYGTWAPPPNYVPEDTYLHDFIGMAWTGTAMAFGFAVACIFDEQYTSAAFALLGGFAKSEAYAIGWTRIAERLGYNYWLPTRVAEVLQGLFLYLGFTAAWLLMS